jgi:hypothetical protein
MSTRPCRSRPRHEPLGGARLGHLQRRDLGLPAGRRDLIDHRARVLAPRRRDDVRAARRQHPGDAPPNPARGAGHDRDASGEVNHI